MILDYIYMSCNQDFEIASFNTRQIKKTGKYLIWFVTNLRIDNFYKRYQAITFRQKLLKNNTNITIFYSFCIIKLSIVMNLLIIFIIIMLTIICISNINLNQTFDLFFSLLKVPKIV